MMKNKDFAVFILTHGRPDNVVTYQALRKQNYTGKIYLLVDDLDESIDRYKENYGDQVIVFDKQLIADKADQGDNFNDLRAILHARNVGFEIAKQLGITYFVQFDDDYEVFRYSYVNDRYITKGIPRNMDKVFDIMLEFYINTPQLMTLCMAQGGDFIGGESSGMIQNYDTQCRKAMNSFLCSTERPFMFMGRMNEDVNTYTKLGSTGNLLLTVPFFRLEQKQTQSNPGGITETYIKYGTYTKSFYTVMYQPSSVKIGLMGFKQKRIHHRIDWSKTVPLIVREEVKKK